MYYVKTLQNQIKKGVFTMDDSRFVAAGACGGFGGFGFILLIIILLLLIMPSFGAGALFI